MRRSVLSRIPDASCVRSSRLDADPTSQSTTLGQQFANECQIDNGNGRRITRIRDLESTPFDHLDTHGPGQGDFLIQGVL